MTTVKTYTKHIIKSKSKYNCLSKIESYELEYLCLSKLNENFVCICQNKDNHHFPKIINMNDSELKFTFSHCGTSLDKLKYEAKIIIDRTNFNIKYKSKTIFPDLGDHFIYDEFTIKLIPLVFK